VSPDNVEKTGVWSIEKPGFPVVAAEAEQSRANSKKDLVAGRYEVNVPYTIRDDEAAALLDDLCAERAARRAKAPTDPRRIVLGGEPCEAMIEGEGHRL
jgi:hypothetical protein